MKKRRIFLVIALTAAVLALASIAQSSQASGWMQTVPTETETPTQTLTPTNTSTVEATPTTETVEPTLEPTNTSVVEDTPTATAIVFPTPTPTPTPASPFPWGQDPIKLIYFLVCGLGLVGGIVLLVFLAIRRAAHPLVPPPAGGPGQ